MSKQSKLRRKARHAKQFRMTAGPKKTTPKHGKVNRRKYDVQNKTAKELNPLAVMLEEANRRWALYLNVALS